MPETPKLTGATLAEYNRELARYARQMADFVKNEGRARSVGSSPSSTGNGLRSIKGFTRKRYGEVERMGIKFPRYLIFVEHGVGRGRSVDDEPGQASSRRPRPFLSAGVEKYQDDIADLVAAKQGDNLVQIIDQSLRMVDKGSSTIRITKS